jgi:hypothetical protein
MPTRVNSSGWIARRRSTRPRSLYSILDGTPWDERRGELLKRLEGDFRTLKYLVQEASGLGL